MSEVPTPYDPRLQVEGSGPPLVFVPGMDGTGRLFYRQVPRLAPRFRVGTYTLRDGAARMETLVEDLAHVIGAIAPGGEPVVVVGESFGGTLALSFALAHPERVRALVVVNSFPRFQPRYRLSLALAAIHMVPWSVMGLFRRVAAFRLHSRHTPRADVRHFLEQTKATTRGGYIGRLRILTEYDVSERLKEIRVPTLFIAAGDDRLIPALAEASYMAARVPGAALQVLEGQGHACLIAPGVDLGAILAEWRGG